MLNFMDYVQQAFSAASRWDRDNSYGSLNATARALLDFEIPVTGLTLNFSSLASPNFATFYALSNSGTVDGSLSYLYSSLPLHITSTSTELPLCRIVPGYRQLHDLRTVYGQQSTAERQENLPTLLYGRLFLPTSHLEAQYLRRLSPSTQLKISCVSASQLKSGGSLLFLLSRDQGKYSTEWLYSTDSALLGVRGLYNFGPDPHRLKSPEDLISSKTDHAALHFPMMTTPALPKGRFSAGAELYYGILNKSGGMSTGLRFATLPAHSGFPYTMTLTLNPLMGNLSAAYAVRAGSALALCSRFSFNFYSYESDFQLGLELWRAGTHEDEQEWARAILRQPGRSGWGEAPETKPETTAAEVNDLNPRLSVSADLSGNTWNTAALDNPSAPGNATAVLKARVNQDGAMGLLWEGRVKALLCSCGVSIDFKRREQIFKGVGLEVAYSS